jgi:hypothetical protein
MKTRSIKQLIYNIPGEERRRDEYKEIPCKDMDWDCFALDGKIPFGNYGKCYQYAPELGKCIFFEWQKESSDQ